MKKILSSVVIVGLVAILVISNATVEAAKKKEHVKEEMMNQQTHENIVVVSTKEQEDKIEKDTKSAVKKQENVIMEKQEQSKKNDKVENDKKIKNENKDKLQKEVTEGGMQADGKVTKEDFAVVVNDIRIELGTDINEIVEQLGEPDDYIQARSCLHDGDDKIYTYGGIVIYTYPQGKNDVVYIVEYIGEEKTPSGIGLGSTLTDLEEAYGCDYLEDAFYTTYELGANATISFQFENEEIVYIEFYME